MTEDTTPGVITRPGNDPATVVGKPPPPPLRHETIAYEGMVLEKDAAVTLRDGVTIYLDVYRPSEHATDLPVLLAWGPYGKHWVSDRTFAGSGVDPAWISPFTGFESPDPVYWTRHDYAVALADPRGLWHSEGDFPHNGPQEREDLFDTIQWLGARPWSNGSVGMLGVSYLAGSQYQAASMRPPALKAISPWECFADWYREFATHGGIPETGFRDRVSQNVSYGLGRTEDTGENLRAHPFDDDYYEQKYGAFEHIDVPAYVVASWSDHGLHSRGTLNAYAQMGSERKWLEVHGEKKWRYFYQPESVERQRAFFDTFLKGEERGIHDWPAIRVELRDTGDPTESTWRELPAWPVEGEVRRLFLDVLDGALVEDIPADESSTTFDPMTDAASFRHEFAEDVDVVGPMALTLWLRADEATDADVFVVVKKLTADGAEVQFPFNALFSDGPVALGWLRASHRALDEGRSSALVPYHPHDAEVPLVPGEPVALDIEIWASGTRFHKGESLAVTVQGRDYIKRPPAEGVPPLQILHEDLRNRGTWTVLCGPQHPSQLRLHIDPAASVSQS
ncbi:CocE/NonD family hydrolase [Microbacterium sp. LRZ72]|uniref:CocE/NonD family hydrolase n=1 Tax=Microbacterium sp. LRZ72 TaxID=2942481 RepID=UPI0029AA12A8|nr:CocE/NonD family hydrolase [Microbacterium sp. LRZ72]MDX2376370.1 CocE/NonD family hydrolase [Microbacterium sp. LRZ72]